MKGYTRTLKDIIDYPAISKSSYLMDFESFIDAMNNKIYGTYLDFNYNADTTYLSLETKYDVMYDSRRGAICQVLLYRDVPVAVYMGAGRELEDTEACYILDSKSCKEIIDIFRTAPETNDIESNLSDSVDLLFWEGTPVDLGESGWRK